MQIDSHQHFWRIDRGDYGWLTPALEPIYRDFLPEDVAPVLQRHGIGKTILVQAAPTVAETEFMLAVARQTPFVAGVVGWVEFTSPGAVSEISRLATDPLLVGLRPMVHDIADDRWLLREDLAPAIACMMEHNLVFDALVKPRHLEPLLAFVERYPDLAIVVDHGAKPDIRGKLIEPWATALEAIARHPNVTCKLSGLVTEAAPGWHADDIHPYIDRLLDLFGPQRLLWGSDWPVVNLGGGYDAWREMSLAALGHLSNAERSAVLGGNAAGVYLNRRLGSSEC